MTTNESQSTTAVVTPTPEIQEEKKKKKYTFLCHTLGHPTRSIDADSVVEAQEQYRSDLGLPMDTHVLWTRQDHLEKSSPTKTITHQEVKDLSTGIKFDGDKLPWHLLDPYSMECIVKVLQSGAKKYSDRNWEKGVKWSKVFRACIGHLFDWWMHRGNDPETGYSHLWHAGCCIMFLIHYERYQKSFDDRPKYKDGE